MSYPCPNCEEPTQRRRKSLPGGGGLVGLFIGMALSDYECAACGTVDLNDFSADVRGEIKKKRVMHLVMVAVGFVVLVGGFTALALKFNLFE